MLYYGGLGTDCRGSFQCLFFFSVSFFVVRSRPVIHILESVIMLTRTLFGRKDFNSKMDPCHTRTPEYTGSADAVNNHYEWSLRRKESGLTISRIGPTIHSWQLIESTDKLQSKRIMILEPNEQAEIAFASWNPE